ncbi:hypothetical protein FB451DRAFT_1164313 [Mycena latifolia]|nr:hypothetical protein FB451DRAFT_1164313 [Mycena latifolia]
MHSGNDASAQRAQTKARTPTPYRKKRLRQTGRHERQGNWGMEITHGGNGMSAQRGHRLNAEGAQTKPRTHGVRLTERKGDGRQGASKGGDEAGQKNMLSFWVTQLSNNHAKCSYPMQTWVATGNAALASNLNPQLSKALSPARTKPKPKPKPRTKTKPPAQPDAATDNDASQVRRGRSRKKTSGDDAPAGSAVVRTITVNVASKLITRSQLPDAPHRASVPPASPPRPRAKPTGGKKVPPSDNLADDPFNLASRPTARPREVETDGGQTYIEIDDDQEYDYTPPVKTEPIDCEDLNTQTYIEFDENQEPDDAFGGFAYHASSPHPRPCHHSADPMSRAHSPDPQVPAPQTPSRPHSADTRSPPRQSPPPGRCTISALSPPRSRGRSPSRTLSAARGQSPSQELSATRGRSRTIHRGTALPSRTESEDALLRSPRLPPPRHASKSLPPSSPLRIEESKDSASDNDYSKQQAEKQHTLDKRAARGYTNPAGSEEDEADDLRDLEDQIEANGLEEEDLPNLREKKRQEKKGTTATKRNKGKGKAVAGEKTSKKKGKESAAGEDTLDDVDGDGDGDSKGARKSGPIPTPIREGLINAYDSYLGQVKALAKECGKSPDTLHRSVGSKVKGMKRPSPWNLYQSYHSEAHPQPDDMTGEDYNALCNVRFRVLGCEVTKDLDLFYTAMPEIKEWNDKTMANATAEWRDKGTFKAKVTKAMKPLIGLPLTAMFQSRLVSQTMGVHVWGFVIDTGGQASFMWGATDEFKTLLTEYESTLTEGMMDYQHILGHIAMEKRARNGGPPVMGLLRPQELVSKEGEGQRDAQRRLFARIMSTMLARSLTAAGSPPPAPAKFKMVWGPKFLDLAYKNLFKLVNYPTVLTDLQFVIGGDFRLKKIGIAQYKEFMPALEKAQLNSRDDDDDDDDVMMMVPWEDAEKEMSPEEQREIALVSTVNGKTLKAVKDSKAYNDSIAKECAPPVPKKSKSRRSRSCSRCSPSRSRSRARPLPAARERSPVATQGHRQGLHAPSCHTAPLRHEEYEPSRYSRDDQYMRPRVAMPPSGESLGWNTPVIRWLRYLDLAPLLRATATTNAHHRQPVQDLHGTFTPSAHHLPSGPRTPNTIHPNTHHPRTVLLLREPTTITVPQLHLPTPGLPGMSLSGSQLEVIPEVRPAKHKREVEDAEPEPVARPEPKLYKCHFNIPGGLTKVFYATGFEPVASHTRADRYTLICHDTNRYARLPDKLTLVLASEGDRAQYESEIQIHGLDGP